MDSKYIRKVETDVLAALGGRRTAFSGSGMVKGDGRVPAAVSGLLEPSRGAGGYRVESKATAKDSFSLTAKDWLDISVSSASAHEEPIFHIRLKAKDRIWEKDVVVVRLSTAMRLGIPFQVRVDDPSRVPSKSHRLGIQTKLPVAFALTTGVKKEALLAMELSVLAGLLNEERNPSKR